jgi:CheY-like chemotaxis protein
LIERVVHRWTDLAATLGFPEISEQARKIEGLLIPGGPGYRAIENAIAIALRRFSTAARQQPKLPLELINGLRAIRIGLVNCSDQEVSRIRSVARRANVEVVIERVNFIENQPVSTEKQMGYNALIVNECDYTGRAARQAPHWAVPVVFIQSRASLHLLSKMPVRAYDFLVAPWDAEELLIRVSRPVEKVAPGHPAATSSDTKRPRVLIADDDPESVAIISEALRHFDMDCDIARGGEQALDAAQNRLPDAILLDVTMVDSDGFEVLKRLRRNLNTRRIPVMLLTARSQKSDIAQGFESRANDYVVKPFQPLELAKRVDRMISARRKPGPPH